MLEVLSGTGKNNEAYSYKKTAKFNGAQKFSCFYSLVTGTSFLVIFNYFTRNYSMDTDICFQFT
jgi:hypothetical protein